VLRTKSFLPLRSSLGAGPFSLGSSLCNVLFREELPVSPGAPRGISASHGAPCVARGALRVHFSYAQWARGRRELLACAKDTRRAYDVHVHTPLLPLPPLPLRLPPPPPPMPPPPPPPPPAPPHPPPPPLLLAIMVCASSVLCARAPRVTEPPGPFAFAFVAPPLPSSAAAAADMASPCARDQRPDRAAAAPPVALLRRHGTRATSERRRVAPAGDVRHTGQLTTS
jgi:hypothetical protein